MRAERLGQTRRGRGDRTGSHRSGDQTLFKYRTAHQRASNFEKSLTWPCRTPAIVGIARRPVTNADTGIARAPQHDPQLRYSGFS